MNPREDPRVVRSRACILAAAVRALEEEGASGVTIEGVAARAGVAKTTVYRLWADRNELLVAAFEQLSERPVVEATADLRADVTGIVVALLRALRDDPASRMLPALMDRAERDDRLGALCGEFGVRRRAALIERLQRGVAEGEIVAGTDVELLAAQLVGPVFYRRFVARQPLTEAEAALLTERALDTVRPA